MVWRSSDHRRPTAVDLERAQAYDHATSPRRAGAIALAAVAFFAAATGPASAQQKRSLIVQSTTSVRDSGMLDQLITPQFRRRFPQYDLKFVAVGTGQAITNARAGRATS